jgi:hypothetical protein
MRALLATVAVALAFVPVGIAHADTDWPLLDPVTDEVVATRHNPLPAWATTTTTTTIAPPPPPPPPKPKASSTSSGNRCTGYEGLLSQYGWDVARMSQIMYRESRCQPGASNSCCSGLLQIHEIWVPKAGSCGVYSRADLYDPAKNICTAAIIYRTQGMQAWAL